MLYHPDLFVYLWLLPVIFLIIIPFLLSIMRSGIGQVKKIRRREIEDLDIETAAQF